jgi:hypothetical protein
MVFYGYRREVHKFSSQPTDRRPLNPFRLYIFPKMPNLRNVNGTFKFRQLWPRLNPQKERLTKDVRYQEFNEVTPDCLDESSQGSLHFWWYPERTVPGDGPFCMDQGSRVMVPLTLATLGLTG